MNTISKGILLFFIYLISSNLVAFSKGDFLINGGDKLKQAQKSIGHISGVASFETDYTISKVRIAKDGDTEYIIGSSYEGVILKIDYNGTVIWENALSGYMNHDVWCADITGDGNDEILVANANGAVYCLSNTGSLSWTFHPNEAPMNAVCVVTDGTTQYVACGGYGLVLYYLSTSGNLLKEIPTSTFSLDNPWGDNAPLTNACHINFLRPVKRNDGTEFLAVNGRIHSMATPGKVYFFEVFADERDTYRTLSGGDEASGHMVTRDVDGDGNEEMLFGRSSMIGSAYVMNVDRDAGTQDFFKMQEFTGLVDNFGYRITQPDIIDEDDETKYFVLFGSSIAIVPLDLDFDSAEILSCKYSFNDLWKDTDNNTMILASAQSGGNCVHVIDLDDSNWKTAYEQLDPPGNIDKILTGTSNVRTKLKSFTAPAWEHEQRLVHSTSEPVTDSIEEIKENYDNPVFLNYYWSSHIQDPTDWNRSALENPNYRDRRDGRNTYDLTHEQCVTAITREFTRDVGIAFWAGHGNDPYYYSADVLKEIMDYADGRKTFMVWPELESHSDDFAWVVENHFHPLAEYAKDKNANIFVRTKNIFWQSTAHMPLWDIMKSGEYANVFVPGMEETTDKMMDVSVPGRVGYWLSGCVDQWGTRCARDNTSYDRCRQHSHQMIPNHFLRQYIYNLAMGATYINRFGYNADYMAVLWKLIATGALYIPERDELLNISPVHLSMVDVNDRYLIEGTSVKWTGFYNEATENANPMVFSHMNGTWPGATITNWDYSTYASGITDRRLHYLPPNPNGMVLITPPQAGSEAQPDAPRGLLKDKLHPLYEDILVEFYTDGYNYYSADGTITYSADTYYQAVEDSIIAGAEKLPLTVSGEVAWVCAQTSPTHLRLTLIDGGYINPSDKVATVTFKTVTPVAITDVLDNTSITISDPTEVDISVPCGLFRFIDIELSEELVNNYNDSIVASTAYPDLTVSNTEEFDVTIETKGQRDLRVELENTSTGEFHGYTIKQVTGAKSVDITFTPENIVNKDDNYRWVIYLSETGDSTNIVSNILYRDVVIVDTIPPTEILVPETLFVESDSTDTLTAVVLPERATHKDVVWYSNDTSVALVDSLTGVVTGIKTGSTDIVATAPVNGISAATRVTTIGGINLPAPWEAKFIGEVNALYGAGFKNDTFTVVGGGSDIWRSSDEFMYVYQPYSNDVVITAKVESLINTIGWSKVGVMIRDTLSTGSIQAMTVITPEYGAHFQYRSNTDTDMLSEAGPESLQYPGWVRLVKVGNSIGAFVSEDGVSWTQIGGTKTLQMGTNFYLGIYVCSHVVDDMSTGVFSNVELSSPVNVSGVDVTPNELTLMVGEEYTMEAMVLPEDAFNRNFAWSSDDESIVRIFSTGNISARAVGSTSVRAITVDGGYEDASVITVIPDTSVSALSAYHSNKIHVYPNPFSDELTITFPRGHSYLTMQVLDSRGSVVMNRAINGLEKIHLLTHEINWIDKGLYLIKIDGQDESIIRKIMHH